MVSRPVAVPVMAKLVIKGTTSASRLWLARRMAARLAAGLPGRRVHVTAHLSGRGADRRTRDGRRRRSSGDSPGNAAARAGAAASPTLSSGSARLTPGT